MASEHWTEILRCARCGKTGLAELSAANGVYEDHADLIPVGFKVVCLRYGAVVFYCAACDIPVKPSPHAAGTASKFVFEARRYMNYEPVKLPDFE